VRASRTTPNSVNRIAGPIAAMGPRAPAARSNLGQAMRAPPADRSARRGPPHAPRKAMPPRGARTRPRVSPTVTPSPAPSGAIASSAASRNMPSKAPLMIRRFCGVSSVTAWENSDIPTIASTRYPRSPAERRDRRPWNAPTTPRAAGSRFRQHRIGHAPDLGHQQLRGAIERRHVPRHRHRIPAMAFEIETRGDITRLRQGQLPGRHQLSRSGEAMGDDHKRAIGAGLLHDRDRASDRRQMRDLQPGARPFQTGRSRRPAPLPPDMSPLSVPSRVAPIFRSSGVT
jgi:hypothetical protein